MIDKIIYWLFQPGKIASIVACGVSITIYAVQK